MNLAVCFPVVEMSRFELKLREPKSLVLAITPHLNLYLTWHLSQSDLSMILVSLLLYKNYAKKQNFCKNISVVARPGIEPGTSGV